MRTGACQILRIKHGRAGERHQQRAVTHHVFYFHFHQIRTLYNILLPALKFALSFSAWSCLGEESRESWRSPCASSALRRDSRENRLQRESVKLENISSAQKNKQKNVVAEQPDVFFFLFLIRSRVCFSVKSCFHPQSWCPALKADLVTGFLTVSNT